MRDHLRDVRMINREGWFLIGAVGAGNAILLVAGLEGGATISLVILAVLGLIWVILQQITRGLLEDSLELAQESTAEWQRESDFAREMVEEQIRTIEDLKRYDLQSSGIHLSRLRTTLVKRHPEMEAVISEVEQPVNVPGIII